MMKFIKRNRPVQRIPRFRSIFYKFVQHRIDAVFKLYAQLSLSYPALSQVMHAQLQANLANADWEIAGSPIELNIDEVYDYH